MLMLSRKVDESILIGEDIVITVTDIKDRKVKLGISAPEGIKILREELKNTRTKNNDNRRIKE